MRLFIAAVCLTGAINASTCFAGNDEPLTGGSNEPGNARFQVSKAREYLISRARAETAHREAIMRHYDWMGYSIGRPNINSDVYNNAQVVPNRRFYSYTGFWSDARWSGF